MKVVLRSDIADVGSKGEVKDVADGYARNFLIPAGKVALASEGTIAEAGKMRKAGEAVHAKQREEAEALANTLGPTKLTFARRTGKEGKLFGSVTVSDIAEALSTEKGLTIDKNSILFDQHLKTIGTFPVTIRFYPEVEREIEIEVVATPE